MATPLVSVIMPVYNGEAYLEEAVQSVLAQTFNRFELLVLSDGSTDRTAAILQHFSRHERIRIITQPENLGLTATRNKGIELSRGEFIAMLDSDDVALPTRLEKQIAFLQAHPHVGLVGSGVELIDKAGHYLQTQQYPAATAFIPAILLFQNYFSQSSVMLRKTALPAVPYRPEFPLAEDYDLWVRMAAQHQIANLPEALTRYRLHQRNISKTKAEALAANLKEIARWQLAKLAISPANSELDLHLRLGQLKIPADKQFVREAELWLLQLLNANNSRKQYNDAAFRTVVFNKWVEVCKVSGLGLWAYQKFLRSPLCSPVYLKKLLKAKLVHQSVLSYS